MTSNHTRPLRSPWVLVDQLTVQQTADVLDRLTSWLNGPDTSATARCTHALSFGETSDPVSVASWTDALAAHLRRLADQALIQPDTLDNNIN